MFLFVFFSLGELLKVGRSLETLLFIFLFLGALLDLDLGRLKVREAFGNITDVPFCFLSLGALLDLVLGG